MGLAESDCFASCLGDGWGRFSSGLGLPQWLLGTGDAVGLSQAVLGSGA